MPVTPAAPWGVRVEKRHVQLDVPRANPSGKRGDRGYNEDKGDFLVRASKKRVVPLVAINNAPEARNGGAATSGNRSVSLLFAGVESRWRCYKWPAELSLEQRAPLSRQQLQVHGN